MKDLAGVDDSDAAFSELDESSEQHLRETAERAVRTRRGTIREFPDRYVDLAGFVHSRSAALPGSVITGGAQDDLEQDPRIDNATVTMGEAGADDRVPFTIQIKPVAGAIVITSGTA